MDTHAWKFHKDIKLNDEEFHQVGGIDLLMELTYSMKYFDQTEGHVLVFIQFYKWQFLAGHYIVELQPQLHSITLSIYFYAWKTTVWSTI